MDTTEMTAIPLSELAVRISQLISAAGLAGIDVSLTKINGKNLADILASLLPATNGNATGLSLDSASSLGGVSVAQLMSALAQLTSEIQQVGLAVGGMFSGGCILLDNAPLVFIGCSTSHWDDNALTQETAELGIITAQLATWANQQRTAAIAAQDAAKAKGQ